MNRYIIYILILIGITGYAEAQNVQCNLLAIEADNIEVGIDPLLNTYKDQFSRPPFSAFRHFKLIKTYNLKLVLNQKVDFVGIPEGISGSLTFEKEKDSFINLRLLLFRANKELLRVLVAVSRGKPFFIAGPSIRSGTLIIGIICK